MVTSYQHRWDWNRQIATARIHQINHKQLFNKANIHTKHLPKTTIIKYTQHRVAGFRPQSDKHN